MNFLKRLWKDEDGQGMTEYILIVALIAIAAIVAVKLFGKQIKELFTHSAEKLGEVKK